MPEKTPIKVTIFSTEYPIQSEADPERVREVAKYVDSKMREIATVTSLRSATRVAILAALNIADELFKERDANRSVESVIGRNVSRLSRLLGEEEK
jgi:cell division protein ZapA